MVMPAKRKRKVWVSIRSRTSIPNTGNIPMASITNTVIRIAGKNASPPSLGTGVLCTLRASGISNSFFLCDTRRIFGMTIMPSNPDRKKALISSRFVIVQSYG